MLSGRASAPLGALLAIVPLPHGGGRGKARAPDQKSYLIRPYQKAPLNPNGVYWL